jgi:hypothetical protein
MGAAGTTAIPATGLWSGVISHQQLVAVHSALLPGGKILMSDGQMTRGNDGFVWNTATGQLTAADAPYNIFCGGAEQMDDGRIMMVGGHQGAHYGSTNTLMFNPATGTWSSAALVPHGHPARRRAVPVGGR